MEKQEIEKDQVEIVIKEEKKPRKKRSFHDILKNVLIVMLILLAIFLFIKGGNIFGGGGKTVITSDLIETRLEEIAELASVNYIYKNMGQFENTSTFYGLTIPFTTKKFILSYNGEIKAGIDLRDIKVDLSEQTITVEMPEAKILSHAIDENSVTVFDEKTSLFNPIKIGDMTSFTSDQKDQMEKEVIEKGLLAQAKESAEKMIKSMLTFEGYEVVFK